ncbi:MAG: helix-turn-helix transcriptional regulator [bacterium]|nr:helix-turn-helix transcriptional regulator [bacterium]
MINCEKLRKHAVSERWSGSAIARKTGISSAAVSKILGGQVTPKADSLKKICDAIGLPIQEAFIEKTAT